jgi:hypothetical protein
VKGKKPEA